MIVLRTLGSSDMAAPGQPRAREVLAQPKRYALLVYLALAEPRGWIRRDALLALFWPETDQTHGRQVLRQTIYLLRQQLGQGAVESRGSEELAVNASAVRCDVASFEAALAEGNTAHALEQYHGDFLAGLHVPDASSGLEDWITTERLRLRTLARDASWLLARQQEEAGHGTGAMFWARRAAALDPLDERSAGDLMRLLARLGDRAGALRVFDELVKRLAEELDVEPGADLRRLADNLREPRVRPAGPRVAPATVESSGRPPAEVPSTTGGDDGYSSGSGAPSPVPTPPGIAPRRASRLLAWGAVAAVLLGVAGIGSAIAWDARRRAAQPPLLAVGPIRTMTEGDSSRLSAVTADLLSTSLARLSTLHVVPVARVYELQGQLVAAGLRDTSVLAAARQAGAGQLMQGMVHRQTDGALQLDLQVMDLRTGAVVHAWRADGSDVFSMVDDATTLVASAYGIASPRERIADVTTQSIVAYRLYEEGLQAYRREDDAVAYRLFLAALNEDSTFAMAGFYAGSSAPAESTAFALWLRAARLAGRATDRERLWILEQVADFNYSPSGDAVAETLAVRFPQDPEGRLALGDVLVHRGEWAAAAAEYLRVTQMDSLSLVGGSQAPDGGLRAVGGGRCLACQGYYRAWLADIYGDSLAAAARTAREWARRQPGTTHPIALLSGALSRLGRLDEAEMALRRADSLRRGSVDIALETANLRIRGGAFAAADSMFELERRQADRASANEAAWFQDVSLRAQGRWRDALALSRSGGPSLQEAATLYEMGRPREAMAFYRGWDERLSRDPDLPGLYAKQHTWMLTHIATCVAALGDTVHLAALADTVQQWGVQSAFGRDPLLHHYIRGLLWRARGDLPRALAEFRASIWSWTDGYTRENYELARVLIDLGRPAEAVYPLQAALRGDLQSSNLYMTRTELHEMLARAFEALGQRDSAVAEYRVVAEAWKHADPIVRQRWERARRAAAGT